MWEFGGVSPLILNLNTKWGSAVMLLHESCTLLRKGSPVPIHRRFSGLSSLYGRFGVEMYLLPLPGIESRFAGNVPNSLIVNDNALLPPSAQGCVTVLSYFRPPGSLILHTDIPDAALNSTRIVSSSRHSCSMEEKLLFEFVRGSLGF